jgi:hypothetical protein
LGLSNGCGCKMKQRKRVEVREGEQKALAGTRSGVIMKGEQCKDMIYREAKRITTNKWRAT